MEDHEISGGIHAPKCDNQLRRQITFVEEPVGELGEASSASTTQSIERFRKVANTLADEALRRRKGLSVIALNEALGKLPSVWSLQGVQAAETLVSAVTEVDSVESRESPALDISENGANGNQLSGVLRTVSRKSCRTTGTSFVSSRKSSCQITAQTESLALPSETQLLLEVCEKEPGERAEWELVPLLRILEKISFTSTLDSSIQHGLAHYMRFLAVTHGTTMFSQGDVGDLFYIILSGSVAVKVMAGDAVSVARTLRAGESFGELALLQRGGRRSATVVTVGHTEFLTIGADQYEELLSNLHQNEIRSKVEVVRHCKIFRNWPEKELYHVAAVMQLRRYGHDEVVVEQGADADSVCFIKSGQVRRGTVQAPVRGQAANTEASCTPCSRHEPGGNSAPAMRVRVPCVKARQGTFTEWSARSLGPRVHSGPERVFWRAGSAKRSKAWRFSCHHHGHGVACPDTVTPSTSRHEVREGREAAATAVLLSLGEDLRDEGEGKRRHYFDGTG